MCNVGRCCWWWSMVSEVECWWLVVGGYSLMFTFTDSVIATQSLAVIQIYYYTATYDEVLTHPLYSSVFICQDTRVRSAVKASSSTNFKQWSFPRVGSIDSDAPYGGTIVCSRKRMILTSQYHSVLLGTGTKVPAKSRRLSLFTMLLPSIYISVV